MSPTCHRACVLAASAIIHANKCRSPSNGRPLSQTDIRRVQFKLGTYITWAHAQAKQPSRQTAYGHPACRRTQQSDTIYHSTLSALREGPFINQPLMCVRAVPHVHYKMPEQMYAQMICERGGLMKGQTLDGQRHGHKREYHSTSH